MKTFCYQRATVGRGHIFWIPEKEVDVNLLAELKKLSVDGCNYHFTHLLCKINARELPQALALLQSNGFVEVCFGFDSESTRQSF